MHNSDDSSMDSDAVEFGDNSLSSGIDPGTVVSLGRGTGSVSCMGRLGKRFCGVP